MQVKTAQQLFKVSGIQQRYYYLYCTVTRAGLKGRGAGEFLLEGPYDVIHDVIVCQSYVFADSRGFPFVFSGSRECVYSNVHTVSCEK